MIDSIVFDMGNVISEFSPAYYASLFTDDDVKRRLIISTTFESVEWTKLDLGSITYSEAARIWQGRAPEIESEIQALCDHWHEHKRLIVPVNQLACALKDKGYSLYLLSNTSDKFPLYKDKIPALRAMNGYILSYEHHLAKPDPAIYNLLFDMYSLSPENCVFIDDIYENIEVGRELGMKGFVFPTDIPHDEAVKRLIDYLRSLGIDVNYEEILRFKCDKTF